jgi:uncharacterized ion transporter superfamily protein YfcC
VAESAVIIIIVVIVTAAAGWVSMVGNYSHFLFHLPFIRPEVTSPSPKVHRMECRTDFNSLW